MGNGPISCCRSKSLRSSQDFRNDDLGGNSGHNKYSSSGEQRRKLSDKLSKHNDFGDSTSSYIHQRTPSILQHISEREPDDSDADPSLNPLNRPIFASRSSTSRAQTRTAGLNYFSDSYSSNSSIRKQSTNTPLTNSQDQGYTSCASTNLTQCSTNLTNSSFDSGIHKSGQQQALSKSDQLGEINDISVIGTESFNGESSSHLNSYEDAHDNLTSPNELLDSFGIRRKASSCSTIFIDNSTISQPDLDQTIRCVSSAIHYHIRNRTSDISAAIFDESIHPLKMPTSSSATANMHNKQDQLIILGNQLEKTPRKLDEPDQECIYNFVSTLFKAAELTSEYAITTLVYLERLMTYAEMDLSPNSWRRMFLGALLLSSKVWEDHAVWNVDYAQILEEISVDDINELERQFLEMIQFNMNVSSSVYAKYYFHLRTLALRNGFSEEQTLLTVNKARELEAKSNIYAADDWLASPIHRKMSPAVKRHTSLEKLKQCGQTNAVLM